MQRILLILLIGVVGGIWVFFALNLVSDPLANERAYLAQNLAQVEKNSGGEDTALIAETTAWLRMIDEKKAVWDALIPPPPPPPPPPPKAPEPPDIAKMLKGVSVGRSQVGKRVKVTTPKDKKGSWVSEGDLVEGCRLEKIDKDAVLFTLYWAEGDKTLTYSVSRE